MGRWCGLPLVIHPGLPAPPLRDRDPPGRTSRAGLVARTGAAKPGLVPPLTEHGSHLSQTELRSTCESTGQDPMPLWLAWRERSAMIMSLFGGNTGNGRDSKRFAGSVATVAGAAGR